MGHPRGTHSRYVIGICLIPLGIYGRKNNSRRITYVIGWCMGDAFSVPFILSWTKLFASRLYASDVTLTMFTTAVCMLFLNYSFFFISFFYYFAIHIFVTLINKDYKRYLSKKTSAILLELFQGTLHFLCSFFNRYCLSTHLQRKKFQGLDTR